MLGASIESCRLQESCKSHLWKPLFCVLLSKGQLASTCFIPCTSFLSHLHHHSPHSGQKSGRWQGHRRSATPEKGLAVTHAHDAAVQEGRAPVTASDGRAKAGDDEQGSTYEETDDEVCLVSMGLLAQSEGGLLPTQSMCPRRFSEGGNVAMSSFQGALHHISAVVSAA